MNNVKKSTKEQPGKPTQHGMTLGDVWFSSKQHGVNFTQLLEKFNCFKNPEYAAACYIVSHPEIFHRIDWNKSSGPIGWYWGEWIGDDENGYWTESTIVGQLSSSYRGLVQSVVELYTGSKHYFDLASWLDNAGDEVYKLFVQSLGIRRDRFVIDVSE
ncbi:DUF2538 family protein [Paenibacillus sinopodophylli]|uniref:DUF2538 family protein n=1 Tax=Paenibacillus sinopodophylli TaxID=1837342 RepID=UPI001FE2D964|nr:DUF2538 family protein [Paenibacillus sinopodophylli]